MKSLRENLFFLTLVAVVGAFASQAPAFSKAPQVVIIVKADGVLANLGLKDIRAIFLGEKLFQDGAKIEPLVNGDEALSGIFFKKVLNKTKAQYKKIWSSKAFVDALVAPAVLPSADDILRAVKKNEGAIGFVDEKDISSDDKKSFKVIYSADSSSE